MPVTKNSDSKFVIYQREQYAKGGLGVWHWDKRDQLALQFVRPEDKNVVDVGCGEGVTLEKINRKFPAHRVLGIDELPENVNICRQFGLRAETGSIYHLPLKSKSVDCVLLMEVIEHLNQPTTAVKEVHRILIPNGRLVIVFPNDNFFKLVRCLTLRFREASYDPGHVHQWTPSEMKIFFKNKGFSIIYSRNIPFYFWPISIHCIIVADKL